MTTKEAIAKAAALFAEWVEGDEFEYEGTTPGKYYACPATDVVRWLFGDVAVRIKPRAKKVLRPWAEIWEIEQRREDATFLTLGLVGLAKEKLDELSGTPADELEENGFPEDWFTEAST